MNKSKLVSLVTSWCPVLIDLAGTHLRVSLLLTNVKPRSTVGPVTLSFPALEHYTGEASVNQFATSGSANQSQAHQHSSDSDERRVIQIVDGALSDPEPVMPFGTRFYQFDVTQMDAFLFLERTVLGLHSWDRREL
eukprot:1175788-Prorocentrum_minimum.AAC.8